MSVSSEVATSRRFNRPSLIPPLREDPFAADDYDAERAAWVQSLWHEQDDLLRGRDRQVEENVRMLLGQQWIVWSATRGRFENLADYMEDDEKRWRHMPVLNRLFLWFVLLQARMTENPPILSWQAGPDRLDSMLAEVMDPVFKWLWNDVEMLDVLDRMFSWLIPSGRAHLKSRIDLTKGDPLPMRGPAALSILGPDGQPTVQRYVEDAPYREGEEGYEPAAELEWDDEAGDYAVREPEPPAVLYEGGIEVDVVTCLEVRGEWGEHVPWHKKNWHLHRSLLSPLQAYEAFGVEIEPDVRGDQAESDGILWRLLHGSGLFGSSDGKRGQSAGTGQEFVTIYELWHRESSRRPGWERTPDSPGGRLCIVTGSGKVIRDGLRTHPFRYTSPIRTFDFVNLPGRPGGTSPQEMLNGPIRTRNRLTAQALGVATLQGNPLKVIDTSQGIQEGQVKGTPGEEVLVDRSRSKAPPVDFVAPGNLGQDVYEMTDRLGAEFNEIGNLAGTEGTAPTDDASGELVKELRYNADRPIASTMRRTVSELGRMAEDWIVMIPTIWDQEKIISLSGEDGIARTLTVYPLLFQQGKINVAPEIESMLPESRGERQSRAWQFWQSGVWGDPLSPEARQQFLENARFPHMSRLARPGGADRTTAQQNVGRLLQNTPAAEIPILPWYDHTVHIQVLELFMKSPEYLKVDPRVQGEFATYWELLKAARLERLLMDMQEQNIAQVMAAPPQPAPPAGGRGPGKKPVTTSSPHEDISQPPPRGTATLPGAAVA